MNGHLARWRKRLKRLGKMKSTRLIQKRLNLFALTPSRKHFRDLIAFLDLLALVASVSFFAGKALLVWGRSAMLICDTRLH